MRSRPSTTSRHGADKGKCKNHHHNDDDDDDDDDNHNDDDYDDDDDDDDNGDDDGDDDDDDDHHELVIGNCLGCSAGVTSFAKSANSKYSRIIMIVMSVMNIDDNSEFKSKSPTMSTKMTRNLQPFDP